MRIRLTIEYDVEGEGDISIEDEQASWREGLIEFQDIDFLAEDASSGVVVKFEEVKQ